jgi:hypothetical protein
MNHSHRARSAAVTDLVLTIWFAIAAFWALIGTNTQSTLSREQLREDPDPLIREVAEKWTPVRWRSLPKKSPDRQRLEDRIREDPARWARHHRLRRELGAWNALESSAALALGAAVLAALADVLPG